MKILDATQIRECDQYTIENEPISSINLMERAADAIAQWLLKKFNNNLRFVIFAGSGNNGGDALAVARILSEQTSEIIIYQLNTSDKLSADCEENLNKLSENTKVQVFTINEGDEKPTINCGYVVVDGIFGSGLNRHTDGYWAELIDHINHCGNNIVSIDIPSGLFCTDNRENTGKIIRATHTLSLQLPKLAFLFAENEQYTGNWHILPIGISEQAIANANTPYTLTLKSDVARLARTRRRFSHKGTFGNALLVAGSFKMTGAAVLSARACMHTGCGLLTVHIPQTASQALQTTIPEAILSIDKKENLIFQPDKIQKFSAIGIGPGIGQYDNARQTLTDVIQNAQSPLVIDADALNILGNNRDLLEKLPENTILTPHPAEFDRMTRKHASCYERMLSQVELAKSLHVIIVLKGAFSSIAMPDGRVLFNSTGNPGMATAGSGDVLTGIILSLLAQKYRPTDAAILGVWLHGMAGDIAAQTDGEEWIIASNIIENLGKAFIELRK